MIEWSCYVRYGVVWFYSEVIGVSVVVPDEVRCSCSPFLSSGQGPDVENRKLWRTLAVSVVGVVRKFDFRAVAAIYINSQQSRIVMDRGMVRPRRSRRRSL
jgi:hypothetical protein